MLSKGEQQLAGSLTLLLTETEPKTEEGAKASSKSCQGKRRAPCRAAKEELRESATEGGAQFIWGNLQSRGSKKTAAPTATLHRGRGDPAIQNMRGSKASFLSARPYPASRHGGWLGIAEQGRTRRVSEVQSTQDCQGNMTKNVGRKTESWFQRELGQDGGLGLKSHPQEKKQEQKQPVRLGPPKQSAPPARSPEGAGVGPHFQGQQKAAFPATFTAPSSWTVLLLPTHGSPSLPPSLPCSEGQGGAKEALGRTGHKNSNIHPNRNLSE